MIYAGQRLWVPNVPSMSPSSRRSPPPISPICILDSTFHHRTTNCLRLRLREWNYTVLTPELNTNTCPLHAITYEEMLP